jgi:DNA-binding NtrC family response regulator
MSEPKGKILAVDDEPHQRTILKEAITLLGYSATIAESGMQVLDKLRNGTYDALITDLQMPGLDGVTLISKALEIDPSLSTIIVTAHGTIETAVDAMKNGAEDYLLKPIDFTVLEVVLTRVFIKRMLIRENRKLQSENEALKRNMGVRYHLANTLGKSAAAQYLQEQIQSHLRSRKPLLILGETGVGRNDIARMLHYNGPWATSDLIFFDCSAVPEELHESHLFGEEAPDGTDARPGLVEKASQGTLVLSNIHLLGARCQPRLARLVSEQKTQRIGGKRFYQVDTRLIATSELAKIGKATLDGTFRLDVRDALLDNAIRVEPLRQRKEDIPILIAATARQMAVALGKELSKIDPAVVERLSTYDFPGNVRELKSLVEAAVIRCKSPVLSLDDFGLLDRDVTAKT